MGVAATLPELSEWTLKSVQSALSDLKHPLNVYSPSAIIGLSLLNSIFKSFAQTCLKETDNGKLQQFNYSRSLITNRGKVERGKIHSARAMAKWEFLYLQTKKSYS